MKKKNNQFKAGNNSLLQTARTKNLGMGKFALLSLKSKPQPPVKKVKVPLCLPNNNGAKINKTADDLSKVSDITGPSRGEKNEIKRSVETNDMNQNKKSNYDDDEVESSVLGMSMNSKNSFEISLSKAYVQEGTTTTNIAGSREYIGKKQNAVQVTAFSSLWPAPATTIHGNRQQLHSHLKNKKKTNSYRNEIIKKRTMDISTGLRFSAPAPMTLNRYQPQMGQEKTAPESKEYLEMQAGKKKIKRKQIEAQNMAEAKVVIDERLKQAFESGEIDNQFYDFGHENKNLVENIQTKKMTLIKKILGKVRQQPTQKWQQNHDKSSAIQAAMSAAAAAVEVATGNPSITDDDHDKSLREEEARAIVNKALTVSRQRKKENFNEIPITIFPPYNNEDLQKMNTQEIVSGVDQFGKRIQFPINEVMMKPNEDSISDLDASTRNIRRIPMVEIHMKDTKHCHDDESVSTLGTPRVFEQLDKLLLTEHRRFQQQPDPINEFLEDNMGGSAAPPPMVTSHDARALIDQIDSGTMAGDMTAGTLRAENAVKFCNLASNCFHPDQRYMFVESSRRSGDNGEESYDDSETSYRDKASNDETWSWPTPFTEAIDNAIRKAEIEIAGNHAGRRKNDENTQLTLVEEGAELVASPNGSEIALRESKSRSTSPRTLPETSQTETFSQPDQHTANFDSLMNIAASKLNTVAETDDESRQEEHPRDRYSTEIDHNSREKISGHGTPRARGGVKKPVFGQPSGQLFSEDQFNLLPAEKPERIGIRDMTQDIKHLKIHEHDATNASKRKKPTGKSSIGLHTLAGLVINEGRFLLEKDDAYWDTLSTIASTANDRSAESDTYKKEFVQPGPIPGEITTSSSEIKSITNSVETENFNPLKSNGIRVGNGTDPNQPLGKDFYSPSNGKLNEMINDVTDLIDANLLDNLPVSKNKSSIDRTPLTTEKYFDAITETQSRTTSRTMRKKGSNNMRLSPDVVDRSKVEESQNGSLSLAASQIAKGIRSVSWGFEEIYQERNSQLDLSDQENNSESSYRMSQKAQSFPERTQESQQRSLRSSDVHVREDEDLFSRTFELSKGLLETIIGSQIVKDQNKNEEQYKDLDSCDVQHKTNRRTTNSTNAEYRDDFHHEEHLDFSETNENDLPPMIHSRLESLRNQRSRALMKFRQIQNMESTMRDRERLKYHSLRPGFDKSLGKDNDQTRFADSPHEVTKISYGDDSDIELKYTTSESNDSVTPSQRARNLRMQLDEAMRASREIQISQNQLGNELNSFKKKYYRTPTIGAVGGPPQAVEK